jgi:LAS superfamily LD-carboxypeptidase LdcB
MRNRRNKYSYGRNRYSYGRRRRFGSVRWDRLIPVIAGIVIVLGIILAFNFSRLQLATKGYSWSEQNAILELTSDKISILTHEDKVDHIKTWIDLSKNVSLYDDYEKYYGYYPKMDSKDVVKTIDNYFTNYVPKLKTVGYTNSQLWTVLKDASESDLAYLVKHKYSYADMKPYKAVTGFQYQDMDKYIKLYNQKHNYNYAVIYTTYPFIYSSNKVTKTYRIQNPANLLNIVKKGFTLPSDYQPSDLVMPDKAYISSENGHPQLRKVAYQAFVKMAKAAAANQEYLLLNSCFRSYSEQQKIYQQMETKYGAAYAAINAASPGSSEHQTGLGIDITSKSVDTKKVAVFGFTSEYKWLKENCYKYGFVIRYASDKTKMTGITNEPWHVRYVGTKAATLMHEKNWCFEEYVLYTGQLPQLK